MWIQEIYKLMFFHEESRLTFHIQVRFWKKQKNLKYYKKVDLIFEEQGTCWPTSALPAHPNVEKLPSELRTCSSSQSSGLPRIQDNNHIRFPGDHFQRFKIQKRTSENTPTQ